MISKPPSALGYRMPAEWEPHESTWLSWPHNEEYWPDREAIESVYLTMIRALTEGEHVDLLVNTEFTARNLTKRFATENILKNRVKIHVIPTNDVWVRDYGPTFIVNPEAAEKTPLGAVQWNFNVWGEKYPMMEERLVASRINGKLGLTGFHPGIVMEGGAFEVNGLGTCLTTEQCLLNINRNPDLDREGMEIHLKEHLGVKKIIWCYGGIVGDDTDGHIDNLVRFVNPNTVLCAYEENTCDPNHANLKLNHDILSKETDQDGNYLEIVKLPMPGHVENEDGRLPASYANFYIGNAAILVPVYNHSNDTIVLDLLGQYFPDRKIVPIQSQILITGNGGPHCITQQQPIPT